MASGARKTPVITKFFRFNADEPLDAIVSSSYNYFRPRRGPKQAVNAVRIRITYELNAPMYSKPVGFSGMSPFPPRVSVVFY